MPCGFTRKVSGAPYTPQSIGRRARARRPRPPRRDCRAARASARACASSSFQSRPMSGTDARALHLQQHLVLGAALDAPGAPDIEAGTSVPSGPPSAPVRAGSVRLGQRELRRRLADQRRGDDALLRRVLDADGEHHRQQQRRRPAGSRKRFNARGSPRAAGRAPRRGRARTSVAPVRGCQRAADGHDERGEPDEAHQRADLDAQAPASRAQILAQRHAAGCCRDASGWRSRWSPGAAPSTGASRGSSTATGLPWRVTTTVPPTPS